MNQVNSTFGPSSVADRWNRIIPLEERAIYAAAGFGGDIQPGEKAALLLVDMTWAFCGDAPMPIEESIKGWRKSCGIAAWDAVASVRMLVHQARERDIPIIYTRGRDPGESGALRGRWREKSVGTGDVRENENEIVDALAPRGTDLVIVKDKPSAFVGTSLISYLVDRGIDTLFICGGTTSGCVRATVVDAFSYSFRNFIVAEGTFDRGETSHVVSLFDMNMKYGRVVSLEDSLSYLSGVEQSG